MGKQQDILRERNIFNDYNIAKLGDKIFVYLCTNGGRSCLPSWWAVSIIGKNFKNSAWYEQGNKTFSYHGREEKKTMLLIALEFASQEKLANCKIWIKTPFGGYVTKNTADKVGFKYTKNAIIEIK